MQDQEKVIINTLSRELKLVLFCSQPAQARWEQAKADELLTGSVNWDLFLDLAIHHQVYPLVYRFLNALAHPAVPETVLSALRQKSRTNIWKTFQMTDELIRILAALERNGVQAVVLKGIPLAVKLYGDATLRPARDLDIFVESHDMEKAMQVITGHGYFMSEPNIEMTPALLQRWLKPNHHIGYWHPDKEICLELHWRMGLNGLEIPPAEIDKSLDKTMIAGRPVRVPGPEIMLLYLIMHGASHAWFRLRWLSDIKMLLGQGGFCWDKLYDLAGRTGTVLLVHQAVLLASQILEAPVPKHVIDRAWQDNKAKRLVFAALPFIQAVNYEPESVKISDGLYFQAKSYELSLKASWRGKLGIIHRHFLPGGQDYCLLNLPAYLHPLYYLVRPLAWFCRRGRQIGGGL